MSEPDAKRILLVEDDLKLAALVREYLEQQGFVVAHAARGDTALTQLAGAPPDLVILDLMLPGVDGLTVCRQARAHYRGPILMLTAQDGDLDEVVGLEVGADDYLTKPVRPRVLLARIRALLHLVEDAGTPAGTPGGAPSAPCVRLGRLVVDAGQRAALVDGQRVELTSGEFDLLWLLARHAGEAVSRDDMYRELRGIEHDGQDRSIDLRVSHLRSKLGDKKGELIKSVRGVGYQLAVSA